MLAKVMTVRGDTIWVLHCQPLVKQNQQADREPINIKRLSRPLLRPVIMENEISISFLICEVGVIIPIFMICCIDWSQDIQRA